MKKTLVIAAFAAVMFSAPGFAQAGNNHRGYNQPHHYSYGHNRYYDYRPNHRYGRHDRHYYRHHSSRHHLRDGLKVAAGALLIGSIIHAANHHKRERVVVRRRVEPTRSSDYWYRIDNEGQCVEVRLNREGQEVWTYVDPAYCD